MFNTVTLSNGLQITMETIPFVRSISFGIWVRNGSRNENESNNGISHFIEHMLFKGTSNRTAKQIADEFDSFGGQLNAYTSKELTCYYARVLDTHFEQAFDVLADMFFNSNFSEDEINKEKNVILEEIDMTEDSPEDLVIELLQYNAFAKNSLRYSILGTKENVNSFDSKSFKDYFNSNYHPENTVIALAGNFDSNEALKYIEKYFGSFTRGGSYKSPEYCAEYTPCVIKKEKDIEQLHLCLGFPGLNIKNPDTYAMAALNTMFGGGMSSRLFQNIREKHGLVYSIYSYNAGFLDTGLFTIYAAMNPKQVNKAIELIWEEINGLWVDKITKEFLDRTKEQLKSNFLLSLENSSSRMSSIGRSQLMLNKITSPDEMIQKIDEIDVDKIYAVAERIFKTKEASICVVGKTGDLNSVLQ